MNKKVFIVTSGEYSDYHIEAVFDTKKKAVEYLQQKGDYYRIETYDINAEVVNVTKQVWAVNLRIKDHKVLSCSPSIYYSDKVDCFMVLEPISLHEGKNIEFVLVADSMNSAIKIANERLNQLIAEKDMFFKKAFIKKEKGFFDSYPFVNFHTGEIVQ